MKRLLLLACVAPAVAAQTYDQSVLGAILERQAPLPDAPVEYAVWRGEHKTGNSVLARHDLYDAVGNGDVSLGRRRLALAQLLGQPAATSLRTGDTLVLHDGRGRTKDMEGMDMQAMMDDCPMMQSEGESGGMMSKMSKMKGCPMTRGMMRGPMHPESTARSAMGHRSDGATAPAVGPVDDGVQTAAVTVGPGGFAPDRIALRASVPARLVFTRTTDRTCATEVQVPSFGVGKTALPLDEAVAVTFTPTEAGTFAFTCGMGTMRGTLIVTA